VNRELVWCVYGVFVGWWLCRWYHDERERLIWEVKHQAEVAALRAREVLPDREPEAPPP
jgi:hypothetical protein